jgi:hypothetical protein
MKTFLMLAACVVLFAGCASEDSPVVDADGPHGALIDPGSGSLNSPTTSPGSSGLSGGTVGSNPGSETGSPIGYGGR